MKIQLKQKNIRFFCHYEYVVWWYVRVAEYKWRILYRCTRMRDCTRPNPTINTFTSLILIENQFISIIIIIIHGAVLVQFV